MQQKKVLERVKRYVSLTFSPWVIFHAFCRLLIFFKINIFERFFQDAFGVANSFDQKVWNQIRPDIMSGLIWFQTFCNGYQQTTERKRVNPFPTSSNFYLLSLSSAFWCHLLFSSAYVLRQPILQTVWTQIRSDFSLGVHSVSIHDQKNSEVHLNLVFNIK